MARWLWREDVEPGPWWELLGNEYERLGPAHEPGKIGIYYLQQDWRETMAADEARRDFEAQEGERRRDRVAG